MSSNSVFGSSHKKCSYCGKRFEGIFAEQNLREHNRRFHSVMAA